MAESEWPSDTSDWEAEEEDDDEETDVVSSPTGFKYNISRLSPQTRRVVKGLFNQTSAHNPPQISLELCGIREEDPEGSGLFYAFQMHEVTPCSVRIGSRDSRSFSTPRCECPDARYRQVRPCKHLIWLFDRISQQALFDRDPDSELTLTEHGFAEELGDPFDQISQIRLDVLADGLRCDISDPDHDTARPSRARVREAREMVAAVAGIQPREIDDYRRDLEASYNRTTLIHRGDLGATLFSLILASHSLAEWVRSELSPSDAPVDPYRNTQQRVSRIIGELDAYSSAVRDPASTTAAAEYHRQGTAAEGPRDVTWAATQIQHSVRKIEKLVSRSSSPLPEWARASAARALVSILKAVVGHRGLFMRLIGNQDTGFVFSALDMLVDQSQFIEELEAIMDSIGVHGAPPSYVDKMRSLIARMRSHKAEDASSAGGSGVPRSETPPFSEPRPADVPGPSGSSSVQSPTPEKPPSATGRGGQAARSGQGKGDARGSKRPGSRAQESSRGSRKRARGA
ncbi:hypothetical protein VTK56DRAFT_2438 [Thermocarpiscus australiensis]